MEANQKEGIRVIGSLKLIRADQAIEHIEASRSQGMSLAGVEGFIITDKGAYQPDQIASNDIADSSLDQAEFIEETKDLIKKYPGHWFEIVYSNQ